MIDPRTTAQDPHHPTTAELKTQGHLITKAILAGQLFIVVWIAANHLPWTWLLIEAALILCVAVRSR